MATTSWARIFDLGPQIDFSDFGILAFLTFLAFWAFEGKIRAKQVLWEPRSHFVGARGDVPWTGGEIEIVTNNVAWYPGYHRGTQCTIVVPRTYPGIA